MQATLFDIPTQGQPFHRHTGPRRRRAVAPVIQLRMALPGADAGLRRDAKGRDIEHLVRLHQRALARGGADRTRRALVERIRPLVIREATRKWASTYRSSPLGEHDAIQECLLWVHQQVDRYRGTTHPQGHSLLPAWIRMVVGQRMAVAATAAAPVKLTRAGLRDLRADIETAREAGHDGGISVVDLLEDLEAELSTPELHALHAEEDAESEADMVDMWRMVARLSPRKRRIVRLVHGKGLDVTEAGRRSGVGPRTAGRLYREALDELRDMALR